VNKTLFAIGYSKQQIVIIIIIIIIMKLKYNKGIPSGLQPPANLLVQHDKHK
jgi:hypothetical protein